MQCLFAFAIAAQSSSPASAFLNVIWNVVGGIATIWITAAYVFLGRRMKRRRLVSIFGPDVVKPGAFNVVYGVFTLDPVTDGTGKTVRWPYRKPGVPEIRVSIDEPVSGCELRATKYLAERIGVASGVNVSIRSDADVASRLDLSCVALGGLTNLKTRDAIGNGANDLARIEANGIFSVATGQMLTPPAQGFDYGLIMKIRPVQFPNRIWLVCAGIGEWGTSGAAYYLAYKFGKIFKVFHEASFAIVVKVRGGQDESAIPVHWLPENTSIQLQQTK